MSILLHFQYKIIKYLYGLISQRACFFFIFQLTNAAVFLLEIPSQSAPLLLLFLTFFPEQPPTNPLSRVPCRGCITEESGDEIGGTPCSFYQLGMAETEQAVKQQKKVSIRKQGQLSAVS